MGKLNSMNNIHANLYTKKKMWVTWILSIIVINVLLISNIFALSDSNYTTTMSAWDNRNNPDNISAYLQSSKFEYNLSNLPTKGSLDYRPWPDNYWPDYKRGLADRWLKINNRRPRSKLTPNKRLVLKMRPNQIAQLSPAEKYDIYTGNFNYPLTRKELNRTRGQSPKWQGICEGWAVASLYFKEPGPVVVESIDGITIPFGASDIKALLSHLQAKSNNSRTYMAGNRCNKNFSVLRTTVRDSACLDVNAGAFHVITANMLGIYRKGFILDRVTDLEVWNHPVFSFSSKILGFQSPTSDAADTTVKEAIVSTTITYTNEVGPSFYPQNSENNAREDFHIDKEYKYILELNSTDDIVGGKWISRDYPDFMWIQEAAKLTGTHAPLARLYESSINN
ncbi:MAG: hypothetical protein HQK51_03965 [Oligoflexia bacterium]|nr:hypothetical protein [Oligoflexia bacterium]